MSFRAFDYATAIAPKCTATLSIVGSLFIITDILKSKEKMGRTYSRILLVMSLYDLLTSIAQGMSTWPIPQGSLPLRPFASGTVFTCEFQGFFTQLGVGAPMYNCSLSFYYLIVIAFAYSEDRVKQIEWFMHGIPLLFSISTAAAGLPLKLYNNAYLWCWIAAVPGNCADGINPGSFDAAGKPRPTCERGLHSWVYRWAIYYGPIWGCVLIITFNMAVVSYLVWAKERASLRFRFGHPRSNVSSSAPDTSQATDGGRGGYGGASVVSSVVSVGSSDFMGTDNNPNKIKAKAHRLAQYIAKKRMKKEKQRQRQGLASQVFWQAFYYVIGFYITWICPTALRMLQTIKKPVPDWLLLTMSMLLPFQGFINFLVYVRPRVVQYRNRHPEKGIRNAIARAIRRTVTVLYVPESRAFHETEIQDIEALDPCYALQVEKEEEERQRRSDGSIGRGSKSQRAAGDAQDGDDVDVMDISAGEISFHRADSGTIEKAPLFRDSLDQNRLDQHRLDELKLLGQDDPSFLSNQPSKMDFSIDMDDSSKRSKDDSKDSPTSGEPNNRNGNGNVNNVSYQSEGSGAPTELWNRPGSPQPPREASKPIMVEEQEPELDGLEARNDDEFVDAVAPAETAPPESSNQQTTLDEDDGNDGKETPQILESVAEEDPDAEGSEEDPDAEGSGEYGVPWPWPETAAEF